MRVLAVWTAVALYIYIILLRCMVYNIYSCTVYPILPSKIKGIPFHLECLSEVGRKSHSYLLLFGHHTFINNIRQTGLMSDKLAAYTRTDNLNSGSVGFLLYSQQCSRRAELDSFYEYHPLS